MSRTLRLKFQHSAEEVVAYLRANNYPYDWASPLLNHSCLMVRIERSDVLIGFLWLHWVAGTDRVMELHICVDPDQHGRWITRRLFRDFKSLVDFAGAKTILTRPSCDAHRDYLTRLGFLPVGIFSLLSVE